jgi:hypothetical protein
MTIPERPTPGTTPAEGRDDLGVPGADTGDLPKTPPPGGDRTPQDPETERRDELADRVGTGRPSVAGSDRPDLVTDTDVPPEGQM